MSSRRARQEQRQLSRQQQQQIIQRQTITAVQELFSGPLPSPDTLARYDEIVPGMADRLLVKFEQQANHRMRLESFVIRLDVVRSFLGLGAGFVFGIAVLIAAILLIMNGHETPGILILLGDFLAYGGAYLYGDIAKRRERDRKMTGN